MEDGLTQQSLLSVPRKTSQNLQILKLVFQIRLQKLVKYMNISINFSKKPLDLKLILKIFNCIIGQKCLSCFSILINIHACIYKNVQRQYYERASAFLIISAISHEVFYHFTHQSWMKLSSQRMSCTEGQCYPSHSEQ